MKKSEIPVMPQYYDRYINLIPDKELADAFDDSISQLELLDKKLLLKLDGKSYASHKWTVKDIFQHLIDTERIFNYRAVLFAREDGATAQSFDHDLFVKNSKAERRQIHDMIKELILVRTSTKSLFESFDNETLLRNGTSWNYEVSILAMGFMILGHQVHHLGVIKEKYYPLIKD